jgi:DNA-binding response OmpR family regulator
MEQDHSHYTVSIVEDEEILREELAFQLGRLGFAVKTFADAPQLYRYLITQPRTVLVLDIGLAGEDGLTLCQHIRGYDSQIGIVFMTARGLRDDRLAGLQAGADAYLVKPIDLDELTLVLRRLGERFPAPRPDPDPAQSSLAAWKLDARAGLLTAPNGIGVRLSLNEVQLLRLLLQERPGAVCTHSELAMTIGCLSEAGAKHRLEVIFSRLRERTLRQSGQELPLRSERGLGYRMLPAPERAP